MKTSTLFTSVLVLSSLTTVACGSSSFSDDDGIPPNDVSGNGNTAAPDASVPPNCDVTLTPAKDGCVVNETLGIFVAPPQFSDGGAEDGTRGHPFSKMQTAIDTANAQKKRVYACIGNYAEQITLADGISIFGDLDCNQSWSVSNKHAVIQSPASPAVRANQITSATRVDSVDMIGPDATTAGGSSFALIANESSTLTIANATIHAGKGADGANGVEGAQLSNGAGINGADGVATYVMNASAPICASLPAATNTCAGATGYSGGSSGAGGWGGHWVVNSGGGGFASVSLYALPSGVGCSVSRPCVCSNANGGNQPANASTAQGAYFDGSGADPTNRAASAGAAGALGAQGESGSAFAFTSTGALLPGDGIAGSDGSSGQGGGGGMGLVPQPGSYANGTNLIGSGGSSGGAGGCPGLAGTFGGGGGGSVAVITVDSPLIFDTCTLQASGGGNGGAGTLGSDPTGGGAPGINYGGSTFTAGAPGGSGGASGWSGSGAGGPSIGIAIHGAPVVLTSTTPTVGSYGHGVAAITSGAKTIPASPDAVASATVLF